LTDISVFGQESNPTTWKLAEMNLAIGGIEANLGPENADTFGRDLQTVTVPKVLGLKVIPAKMQLMHLGFNVALKEQAQAPPEPALTVVAQSPPYGHSLLSARR
jgi:hypothetical protein